MINHRLVWDLESNNLISKNQAGLRKKHSINDHLVRLESFIRDVSKRNMSLQYFFILKRRTIRQEIWHHERFT